MYVNKTGISVKEVFNILSNGSKCNGKISKFKKIKILVIIGIKAEKWWFVFVKLDANDATYKNKIIIPLINTVSIIKVNQVVGDRIASDTPTQIAVATIKSPLPNGVSVFINNSVEKIKNIRKKFRKIALRIDPLLVYKTKVLLNYKS